MTRDMAKNIIEERKTVGYNKKYLQYLYEYGKL